MNTLFYLLQKEFIQIFRNSTLLRMMVFLPLFQLLVLPWAASFEQKNINLSVIDNDHTPLSRQLTEKINSSGYFKLCNYSDSYQSAIQSVEKNKSDLILEIPANFEDRLIREQKAELNVSLNAVNGQKAGLGNIYINSIIGKFNQDISLKLAGNKDSYRIKTITLDPYYKYNREMNYRNYMVPGILAILLTMVGGVFSSMNIVKEREQGTIEQINVSPISKFFFILGKMIPFLVIGMVILSIGLFIAWAVYGILPRGNLLLIYLFAFLYLIAFLGFGLLISTFAATQQQALMIAMLFIMIFSLMGGLFTPISSMPSWAQFITRLNPIRYFIEVQRMVFLKGSSLKDISPQILSILIFGIVFNGLAVLNYKKTN